jgi:hypothetical protein
MAALQRRATRPARYRAALWDFIRNGNDEFFDMIDDIEDATERLHAAQVAFLMHYYGDDDRIDYIEETIREPLRPTFKERYLQLYKYFIDRFGSEFFIEVIDPEVAKQAGMRFVEAIETLIEPFIALGKTQYLPLGVLAKNKAELYKMSRTSYIKNARSGNFASAALIRQALIEAKGDPHAAAKIVMAGPKRDKKEKKGKKEKLRGVGKKDGSFEMPVSKYGNITEPVWYINKKPKVAKQATKTNSTIIVPGATKPMPVYSVVNIAMVDGNGHGRTWGFFYDDANERVIISFARPQYDTDANVAGLVKFIESRLGMVSTTTDLYYKYFRDRGIVIPLATAAPSRSSLSSVYGWDADHLRNMTENPFDEGNFEDLDGVYSRSDEEE